MAQNEQILYDLIVHEEWKQEPQLLDQVESYFWQYRGSLLKKLWKVSQSSAAYLLDSVKTQFRYQASFGCPPLHFINLMNNCLPWIIALSPDGFFVAVLQDSLIEIRTSENFEQVISKCKIEKDAFPRWRKMVWSEDGSYLCFSNSFGDLTIFDVTGIQKYHLPSSNNVKLKVPGTLSLALCHLEFILTQKDGSSLLYVCTYQGYLTVYKVGDTSCEELWTHSFVPFHPYGLAGIAIDLKNRLLIAAGNYGKEPFPNVMGDYCYGSHCGISLWRFLNDSPHLTLVEDQGKALQKISRRDWLKSVVLRRGNEKTEMLQHGVYKLKLSHDGKQIVTLHLDGRISFWSMPSMRLVKTWTKSEQPGVGGSNNGFTFDSQKKDDISKTQNVINVSWWSDKEVVLAAGSGDLKIASCESLANMLGESSEKFDPWPSLSQVVDGSVLVLECEKRVTDPSSKSKSPQTWNSEEEDGNEVDGIRYRFKELTKQMLYFITEAERFLPAVKPPRVLTNVYRLLCLKSTTPEELYARKINLEHYGEALDLAKRFGLNTDLVYERQWKNKRVTKITIHDYLSKIRDREWVLDECLLRVADDFDSTEELLKYGLLGTSWEIFCKIDEEDENEKLPFKIEQSVDHHHSMDDEETQSKDFNGKLSKKQYKLCKYRRQLLHYLDRLSTYEVVLGGSFKARDKFDKEYFTKFRCCNMVHQAVECARDEDAFTLEHLFSYHGAQLLPYWLPILSNFPETTDIRYFEPVIPEVGEPPEDPEILPWLEKHHREEDWVEQSNITNQIKDTASVENPNNEELGAFIFEQESELKKFYSCQTKGQLHDWFLYRVHRIDELSGQIDKCCELLDVGIKRGLDALTKVHQEMEAWRVLVYEVGVDSKMRAIDFMELSASSKIKLLMSKSSEETFVKDFKTHLMPFLRNIGKKDFKRRQKLLHDFMVEIAKTDLTCCLKLLEQCSPEMIEPILPDMAETMTIGIDCIYACKRADQLNQCFSIVECLPSREEGVISQQIEELHRKLDQLENLLTGAEILQHYNNPQTISYIGDIKDDTATCKQIMQQLVKNSVSKGRSAPKELNTLLGHLVKLSREVFKCCDVKVTHQIFVEELLRSGSRENISIAEELLTPSKLAGSITTTTAAKKKEPPVLTSALHLLKYDVSVSVTLEAAREYFNAAMSAHDSSMDLSKLCLSMIKDCPDAIQEELDLINSLSVLNEFNVAMLPLQVRLCADKLEIVDQCLKEKKNGYKKKDKLIQLSNLLKICGQDTKERLGQVNIKIAESAFDNKDFTYAGIVCVQLVDDNYPAAWWICRKLGECTKYTNFTIRQKLLSFALTYCPVHHIEEVLQEKTQLETQILYERLGIFIKDDKNDKQKEQQEEQPGGDEKETTDGANLSILKKTTTTTKKLISSVTDNRWIGTAMNWVKTTEGGSRAVGEDRTSTASFEREIEAMKYHPFYSSLDKNVGDGGMKNGSSNKKFNLSEYSDYLRCVSQEKKVFNQLVLRNQKIAEHRSVGTELQDTDPAVKALSEHAYNEESCLCLAYMMATSAPEAVHSVSEKRRKNTFAFLFSAYFYALQEYFKKNKVDIERQRASIYNAPPKDVIVWMLKVLGKNKDGEPKKTNSKEDEKEKDGVHFFLSNMNKLQDLMQAKMLQDLDKGVDIERFAVDDEYKRETVLGLAMSLEDELINTSLLLAEKYDIPAWEVMLSHAEYLFTDAGLKAKAIRESLNKWKVDTHLKPNGDHVFERMRKYVYPELDGKDHNALLLFYVFLMNCSSLTKVLEGTLTLDAHSKLLKKIKAAAPSINYKLLVHGDSPLDVIRDCVDDNNVHLLAKIASKIPQADGTFLSANKIFLANAIRMFWKKNENKDWINQYDNCKQHFVKFNIGDVVTFADHVTFTVESLDLLTQDVRLDISKRVLKYLRQQKGQDETKQRGSDDYDSLMEQYNEAIKHVECSIAHLKTMSDPMFGEIFFEFDDSAEDKETFKNFSRKYDLSRGQSKPLEELFCDMFTSLLPFHKVSCLRELCSTVSVDVRKCFQGVLQEMLQETQENRDFTKLTRLIENIKLHQEKQATISNDSNKGIIISSTHVLDVVRPFCADVTVSTDVKSHVLRLLENSIKMADEDVSLLLFYQSQSVIGPAWQVEIEDKEIETCDSRLQLFDTLLSKTSTETQTSALGKLLRSWPTFGEDADENHPWVRLMRKMIEVADEENILLTLKHACVTSQLSPTAYQSIYKDLVKSSNTVLSVKWMLSSSSKDCYDTVLKDISSSATQKDGKDQQQQQTITIDKQMLDLIFQAKLLYRFVETPLYQPIVAELTSGKVYCSKDMIKMAVSQLRGNGYEAEAGFLLMKTRGMKSSFFTLDNCLEILNYRLR